MVARQVRLPDRQVSLTLPSRLPIFSARMNFAIRNISNRLSHRAVSIFAIIAISSLFCVPAVAHQLSDSFLIFQVTNSQIIGHWDIALKDLLHARGLDPLDQKF